MRPETNDDYEVLDFIGRGGYGEVFLARDRTGCFWAVKVVYRVSFDHERPFEREFEGISKFEPISKLSESQLQILHVGRRDQAGYFYYIMELADDIARGRDIRPAVYFPRTLKSDLQQHKRIAPRECCRLGRALVVALENLHQHRLVHRDIKPANIIFVNDRPKLADPGLVTDADKSMTCAGTDGYIPPEGPGSARADIYSLGIVLYEAMTGNSRWDFPKLPEDFEEWPDHPLALELNRIINKACRANVRKRYQSARELKKDLDRLSADTGQDNQRLIVKPAQKIVLNAVVSCLVLGAIAFTFVFGHAWFKGRSAEDRIKSGADSSAIAPAWTGGKHPVSSEVLASLEGQWHGLEQGEAKHWQVLTFYKSPEGNLQAEMKDITDRGYIRTSQSLEFDGNHIKIVFNIDKTGRLVSCEAYIDYAWKRISGTLFFISPNGNILSIPVHFDYMGAGGNKLVASGASGAPEGQWLGQIKDGGLLKFTFTRSSNKALQMEMKNLVNDTIWLAQSITLNGNHLVMDLKNQRNGRLSALECDVNYESNYIDATWDGNKKWRLFYIGP